MTPRSPWILVGVALIAGAAGGAVGRFADGDRAPNEPRSSSSAGAGEPAIAIDSSGPIDERVARLERAVARLERERQIARLLSADGGASSGAGSAIDDPVFEVAVRDVVQRIDEERGDERRQQSAERVERFASRWSTEVADKLGLNADQKQKIAQIMREQLEAMSRLREGDGGMDPERWRESFRTERDKSEKKLAEVLTASQLAELEDLRERGELPGPWGRRGGPRERDR